MFHAAENSRTKRSINLLTVSCSRQLDVPHSSANLPELSTVLELELIRLRQMSAEEKLAVSDALWREAWALRRASITKQHPDWAPAQIEQATREALIGGSA